MEPAPEEVSRRRKRRASRWALRLAFGLLVAFAVLQLLLLTPWPGAWLAARLERKLGLEVEVARVGWTPWSGVKVSGVKVFQPKPLRVDGDEWLLDLEEVRVEVAMRRLLTGEVRIERLEIERPRLHLRGEMLVDLLRQAVPPPAVATARPDDAPVVAAVPEQNEAEEPQVADAGKTETAAVAEEPTQEPRSSRWQVGVTEGEVMLEWGATGNTLAGVSGLELELRKDGPEGTGRLAGEWSVPPLGGAGAFQLDLAKDGLAWRMKPIGQGDDVAFEAAASALPGLPWQATTRGERAKGGWTLAGREIHAEKSAWQGGGGGWALVPGSWKAGLRAEAGALEVPAFGWRGDRAEVTVVLDGGRLQVPEARVVGESGAVLANAWADAGGARGTVRLVLPPEVAGDVGRRWIGRDLPWRPLAPGNRVFLDVGVEWVGGPVKLSVGDGWMEWMPGAGLPEAGRDGKGAR